MKRCIGEPVSWMRLERHFLGETDDADRARIDEHLAACAACRACLAFIEGDERRPLPALRLPKVGVDRAWMVEPRWAFAAAALVVALAVGLWRRRMDDTSDGIAFVEHSTTKGGDVSFRLVRDDGETVAGEHGVFREGDRFKVLITCAPTLRAAFDLLVTDADGASFPLAPATELRCGNGVPFPGAFRLTGRSPKKVCVAWSETGSVDRSSLGRGATDRVLCMELVTTSAGKP